MSTTNYPLGSKLNPFTENDHNADVVLNRWSGGWVGPSYNLTYYDHQNVERIGIGSYSSPYDDDVYAEMSQYGRWIGGWVLEKEENGIPHEFPTYLTTAETAYRRESEDDAEFGSEDFPIPLVVYEEMCELDIWTGGWVQYPDGTIEDIPENDGGGSGSGSGCGCGCDETGCGCGCGEDEGGSGSYGGGSSVAAGNYTTSTGDPAVYDVTISWTSGTTTGDITSSITAEAVFSSFSSPSDYYRNATPSLTLDANWIGNNGISAVGVYSYEKYNHGEWEIRYGHINVACTAH